MGQRRAFLTTEQDPRVQHGDPSLPSTARIMLDLADSEACMSNSSFRVDERDEPLE